MKFQFNNTEPIYIQIVEQLKLNIISGELKPQEPLPSVRELALLTKVNPNTMQKALSELEECGLIYTERTCGKFVTGDTSLIGKYKEEFCENAAKTYLSQMKQLGLDNKTAIDYLNNFKGE